MNFRQRLAHEKRRAMRPGRNIGSRAPHRNTRRLAPVLDLSWRCYDARVGHGGFAYDNHAWGEEELTGMDDGKGTNFYTRTCIRCGIDESLAQHDV